MFEKDAWRKGWNQLNHWVFWPPFLLLSLAMVFSLVDQDRFFERLRAANHWILDHFDRLFDYTSFAMVLICIATLFSPIARVKIGGKEARPILDRWRWFAIVLCTTIAVGILFWGTAEPLYHFSALPESLGVNPGSPQAAQFAMGTMFMHWSITPYAIYAIPALLFALGYYNKSEPFSLRTILFPLIGHVRQVWWSRMLDAVCLFALVAGMAASLGAGILSLTGGLANLTSLNTTPWVLGLVALTIVITFTISAATGLLKGIRVLSNINLYLFILLSLTVLVFGPTRQIFALALEGLGAYLGNFLEHSLAMGRFSDREWSHSWTTFYWANWMAWAPVTALFLGRIAYGYTVREFLLFNWLIPSGFGIAWMSIFSGATLHFARQGVGLQESLTQSGPESVIYAMLEQFPLTQPLVMVFLVVMFVSYVTAADSNTEAMSGISSTGISPETPEPPVLVKFLWGGIVGLVAWVMVSFAGLDGIRMLSDLGGFPALLLLIFASLGMVVLLIKDRWGVSRYATKKEKSEAKKR